MEIKINIDAGEVLEVLENIKNEIKSLEDMKVETKKNDDLDYTCNIKMDAINPNELLAPIGRELTKKILKELNE
ncbi:hypothetical protein [Clostridium autoethanogenum]|uniref:Uncharacterized protein n=1 Tax=Clostridium autoethanogenum DSM 10061 TaxID=1341692 RepID=A0ABN4BNN8_9CLOT|nr:hypothetical protein [Clostridium autoethanogenum]AGY77976.1 hypothetical protein CAETHG_3775 [Clostridium autoethanogenum DSM 10061]ALU38110.1 Hypothetical protein CLAU_3683 [Clostridium autoethanogenum DSM 10061]OVY50874.1 hypothetical protein WX72_02035 [Clostridium autoethanogenum]